MEAELPPERDSAGGPSGIRTAGLPRNRRYHSQPSRWTSCPSRRRRDGDALARGDHEFESLLLRRRVGLSVGVCRDEDGPCLARARELWKQLGSPAEFVWPAPARCRSAGRWRPRIWPGPPSAGRVFASSQALLNSLYEQTPPRRIDIKGPRVCRPAAGGNGISNPLAPLASRLSHSGIEFGEMRRGEFGGGTWSRYRHRRANKGRPTRTWVRG